MCVSVYIFPIYNPREPWSSPLYFMDRILFLVFNPVRVPHYLKFECQRHETHTHICISQNYTVNIKKPADKLFVDVKCIMKVYVYFFWIHISYAKWFISYIKTFLKDLRVIKKIKTSRNQGPRDILMYTLGFILCWQKMKKKKSCFLSSDTFLKTRQLLSSTF